MDSTVNLLQWPMQVCGKPLFRAPIGRSLAAFQAETVHHNWPSFREEEWVKENIIIDGDKMTSTCGTHLGHDMPDADGRSRACINLVCISGQPESQQ